MRKWLSKGMGILSKKIAIDLGTAYSIVAFDDSRPDWRTASFVAVERKTGRAVSYGDQAKEMQGKSHQAYDIVRPLKDGVVADYEATRQYLNYLLDSAIGSGFSMSYKIFLCVPWGATSVELKGYEYSLQRRRTKLFLVREPFAAALGSDLEILGDEPKTIVDMGGGTTEIATIASGFMLQASSLRAAGNFCDELIIRQLRRVLNYEVGLTTAERLKQEHASVWPVIDDYKIEFKGSRRDTQLPDSGEIGSHELRSILEIYAIQVEKLINSHLQRLPAEAQLAARNKGICLTGGTSLIKGWQERLEKRLGIPVRIADRPTHSVIMGMKKIIQSPSNYRNILKISQKIYSS